MWTWLKRSGQYALGRLAAAKGGNRGLLMLRLENCDDLQRHLGSAAFGQLLVSLSMRLSSAIRTEDPVRIVAPGLFAVTLLNRAEAEAMRIALRLQRDAQHPVNLDGQAITPVFSGVMIHPRAADAPSLPEMSQNACFRLDSLPAHKIGTITLFDHDPALCSPGLPASVSQAVADNQISAYFQPQISCHTGMVTGFEALARWHHPSRGTLAPGSFMPGMTEQDHHDLTRTILRQSISALKQWDRDGRQVPTVSVNISNCELSDPSFATGLLWELDRQDIRPGRLVLEVLESVAPVTSSPAARENLSRLSEAGCRLDLDDFGTGYASLDAIRQFGVNRIKIDRSFVLGCDVDAGQQRMILAILALAERLGISTLAEGVESLDEHTFLAQMGCDEVQGYAIARPMPLHETQDFLDGHLARIDQLPSFIKRDFG
ncbi:EAL domain-containing protein [Paracoccus sp. Z330]|uniref:EAL domain-containing protein n=1 Tax=Paracoccus onchidii TaxID=3017813 RepID=A0ABT4Z9G3_9RHOB|nr:EAL domain-containing protein [Paracoccus onchidii]MDB6175983.1 EAL domain-containing protein [Paracoccus onchidii]